MECLIPIERGIVNGTVDDTVLERLRESHKQRDIIVFDECLEMYLYFPDGSTRVDVASVWINDALVLETFGGDNFIQVECETGKMLKLNEKTSTRHIFRSSVVMNNGYNNILKLRISYIDDIERKLNGNGNIENEASNGDKYSDDDDSDVYLPSFEPVYSWVPAEPLTNEKDEDKQGESGDKTQDEDHDYKSVELSFPIYSLINMRLRNTSLDNISAIISCLDFQTSKAAEKFVTKHRGFNSFKMEFEKVSYNLMSRKSQTEIDAVCDFPMPMTMSLHDSYSISYKLPLVQKNQTYPHHVKINLKYDLVLGEKRFPVNTIWETDVTLKRAINSSFLPNSSSASNLAVNQVGRPYGVSPKVGYSSPSTSSLLYNKLKTVKFSILNNNLKVVAGKKFILRLQIVNTSPSPLDLVVYYNNQSPSVNNSNNLSLERQFQLYKRYKKITEGIILLSNDYKIPMIDPHETYFVDLSFIAIMSGYYPSLAGLKLLDLKTNELIEIGQNASILVK
ncbi:hypothetical protein RNJ44_01871 [Nakaseomyces bracarensis]|uniref:Uncharacterized protein n=1 Tax=Nakaseomyces bracarensis TaxID=273131 RepID=A0ABR4NP01_9SACH